MMNTQSQDILNHLELFGHITPREALELYGCMRLAARIRELRKQHCITTQTVKQNGKRFARYWLLGKHKEKN